MCVWGHGDNSVRYLLITLVYENKDIFHNVNLNEMKYIFK